MRTIAIQRPPSMVPKRPVLAGLLIGAIWMPAAVGSPPESLPLGGDSRLAFATVAEGAAVLGAEDDFTRTMSPFDRQARLRAGGAVSAAEHRAFAARNVLAWDDSEGAAVAAALDGVGAKMDEVGVRFPARVLLVKTSGDEEGGAAYTRGAAVMLPVKVLASPPATLRRLICHELFHVLSRDQPDLRDALYAAIGFRPCGDVRFPADLEDRRITNPDAPSTAHFIHVEVEGARRAVVPVLYSRQPGVDAAAAAPLFATMEFRLMAVRLEGDPIHGVPDLTADGKALLLSPDRVGLFFEQVGRNTGYIIHPEEILADNFVLLVLGGGDPKNPEIVTRVGEIIRAGIEPPEGAATSSAPVVK
jgi:hypothetical protein